MKRTRIKNDNTPESVYKYMTPDVARKFFSNFRIRATRIFDFNDPFDSAAIYLENPSEAYRISGESMALPKLSQAQIERKALRVENQVMQKFHDLFGICCFSADGLSIPMWSYYGDGHKGICVSFDGRHDFFHRSRLGLLLKLSKIKYRKDMHGMIHDGESFKLKKNVTGVDVALTKSSQWRLEKEWRMIFDINSIELIKSSDTSPDEVHLAEVPKSAVRDITLGIKASEEFKQTVQKFCNERGIKLYQAMKIRNGFLIERRPV